MDVRAAVTRERLDLVARLRGLDADGWATPSLCEGWTVHHVLAHLQTPFEPKPRLARDILRSGGITRGMQRIADRLAATPPHELLDRLERHAETLFVPPGLPLAAPLTDTVVHAVDIRWPLGDDHTDHGDPARLTPCLDFLTGCRAALGFLPPARLRGLRLVATDLDRSWGDGVEVAGAALHLAAGALGRQDAMAHLSGPGVAVLRARLP